MISQPLKWYGGKHYLAAKIVALMPPHKRYLEAYAGGLSVLMRKPCDDIAEWVNDTNHALMNFWNVLNDPMMFDQFVRMVETIPVSEDLFKFVEPTTESLHPETTLDRVAWAVGFFIRMRQSRQGLGESFCTPTSRTRRGMNENVSAWLTAVAGLPDVHVRLRRVEVWNRPAIEAIRALDSHELLVYADPPYLHETRSSVGEYGKHEMTPADHSVLLRTLAVMRGKFMLSGYRSVMYDNAAIFNGWHRVDFDLPNNASSSRSKERRTECLWMNFNPDEATDVQATT